MRVISGQYRGRVLTGPRTDSVRPTADKVKEAVFNILASRIVGARWLELFGGAGGMGIEALSRGAQSATFVDAAKESFRLIKSNLERVGADGGEVLYGDFSVVLKRLEEEGREYDLIYLDPPYAGDLGTRALDRLSVSRVVGSETRILLEHEQKAVACPDGLAIEDERRYGRVRITTFIKKEDLS